MARFTVFIVLVGLCFASNSVQSWIFGNVQEVLNTGNLGAKFHQNLVQTLIKPIQPNEQKPPIEIKGIVLGPIRGTFASNAKIEPRARILPGYKSIIRYTIGSRQNGDRIVATHAESRTWTVPQNTTQNFSYPKNGTGAIVSFVEVVVDQSSNLGRGFITSGGVGQRQIGITVEAYQTLFYRVNATIYGV